MANEFPGYDVVTEARLTNTEGGHNKFYNVYILRSGLTGSYGQYSVHVKYGRIGGTENTSVRVKSTSQIPRQQFENIVYEKTSKGYKVSVTSPNIGDLLEAEFGGAGYEEAVKAITAMAVWVHQHTSRSAREALYDATRRAQNYI